MLNSKKKLSGFLKNIPKRYFEDGNTVLTSFAYPVEGIDFNHLLNYVQNTDHKYFFGGKPAENSTALGVSSLISINKSGDFRLNNTEKQIVPFQKNFTSNWKEYDIISVPLFLGGTKFSSDEINDVWNDYSDSDWFVPRYLFLKFLGKAYLVINFLYNGINFSQAEETLAAAFKILSNSGNERIKLTDYSVISSNQHDLQIKESWNEKVNRALDEISKGIFQKIVLSRQVKLELSDVPTLPHLLSQLSEKYPLCYIFAYRSNKSVFFGASPEKLAKISHGWIEADALAGSTPRGKTEEEDIRLANELLSSRKNLAEQNAVVEFIANSFTGFSEEINYSSKPIIRKLPNIQHLWTPIRAKLKTNKTLFSILKEIHPTPAICGVPWNIALSSIKAMEDHRRGLFAGIIGWFNFESEGEFAVAIRSALLKEKELYAFAGCGIVNGSDPEEEFEETELKLKPIMSLFENESIYQP